MQVSFFFPFSLSVFFVLILSFLLSFCLPSFRSFFLFSLFVPLSVLLCFVLFYFTLFNLLLGVVVFCLLGGGGGRGESLSTFLKNVAWSFH